MNNQVLETLFSRFYIINPRHQQLWCWLQNKREELARLDENKYYQEIARLTSIHRERFDNKIQTNQVFVQQKGYAQKPLYHNYRFLFVLKRYKQSKPYADILEAREQKQTLLQIKRGVYSKEEAAVWFNIIEKEIYKELAETSPAPPNIQLEYELKRKISAYIKKE